LLPFYNGVSGLGDSARRYYSITFLYLFKWFATKKCDRKEKKLMILTGKRAKKEKTEKTAQYCCVSLTKQSDKNRYFSTIAG
jgi:hypothetical protein